MWFNTNINLFHFSCTKIDTLINFVQCWNPYLSLPITCVIIFTLHRTDWAEVYGFFKGLTFSVVTAYVFLKILYGVTSIQSDNERRRLVDLEKSIAEAKANGTSTEKVVTKKKDSSKR